MKVLTPPARPSGHELSHLLFLAGSIDMGAASPWQARVIEATADFPGAVCNPRRPDWDSSWGEGSPQLKEQINWELDLIEVASTIFFYFEAGTRSPISLLEFGLVAGENSLSLNTDNRAPWAIVVCEPGFWRRTNVLELCRREGLLCFETLEKGIRFLQLRLEHM